jgi:hypothetical protein
VVQHREYRPVGERGPVNTLRAADRFWFERYATEANRMWADGSFWPLSVGRALARPPLLDSFEPGLDEVLSQAMRLVISGVTRGHWISTADICSKTLHPHYGSNYCQCLAGPTGHQQARRLRAVPARLVERHNHD